MLHDRIVAKTWNERLSMSRMDLFLCTLHFLGCLFLMNSKFGSE
jgi:hypothetical protein